MSVVGLGRDCHALSLKAEGRSTGIVSPEPVPAKSSGYSCHAIEPSGLIHSARNAFKMTATSIASCSSAP